MIEAAAIIKSVDEGSLVVIDELGRGTSTYEGFGLAWAIADHLVANSRCLCLFATHFHELRELASHTRGVVNFHVSALVGADALTRGAPPSLKFLYQIMPGYADQSYGIQVAQMANFPLPVIRRAKLMADELEIVERLQLQLKSSLRDCEESQALKRVRELTDEIRAAGGKRGNSGGTDMPVDGDETTRGAGEDQRELIHVLLKSEQELRTSLLLAKV
eukprot:GHVT01099739.1.p1 GENE.GHVT01099739.1~~GHVT01099739.1.p1  ORF type:complete len:218 (-),score=41.47 GHVT01099739.1:682-1335(-)